MKDLNSVLADLRLLTRKVRRRVPTDETGKTLQLPDEVLQNVLKCQDAVATVKSSMTQLKAATSRKGNVLSEGEFLRSAEVEDLLQQVSSVCPPVMGSLTATDRLRANLDSAMEVLNGFATAAQNGEYDMDRPAVQVRHTNSLTHSCIGVPSLLDSWMQAALVASVSSVTSPCPPSSYPLQYVLFRLPLPSPPLSSPHGSHLPACVELLW